MIPDFEDILLVEKAKGMMGMRTFSTGATRDTEEGKPDYEGFLSSLVIRRYGEYMHGHRLQADGSIRDSDNWQKGMPTESIMKSGWRHFFNWWSFHRGQVIKEHIEDALCALIFNASIYLHQILKERRYAGTNLPSDDSSS